MVEKSIEIGKTPIRANGWKTLCNVPRRKIQIHKFHGTVFFYRVAWSFTISMDFSTNYQSPLLSYCVLLRSPAVNSWGRKLKTGQEHKQGVAADFS